MGPKKQQVTPSKQQQQITYQQKHQHQLEEQRIEIDELKKEIKLLKETVAGLKMDVTFMNSRLEISHQVTSVLHRQMDDLQQYSRRYSVLLENVPKKTNETSQEVEEKVEDILINDYKVDSSNLALEFDKAHRLGKPSADNTQSIVIRFKSHSFRSNLYVDRKNYQNGRNGYKLRVALTSSRQKLFAEIKRKVEVNEKNKFAYASVNGDLKVRLVEKYRNKEVINIKCSYDID